MNVLSSQASFLEVFVCPRGRKHARSRPINFTNLLKLIIVVFDQISRLEWIAAPVTYKMVLSHIPIVHRLVPIWVFSLILLIENRTFRVAALNVFATDVIPGRDEVLLALGRDRTIDIVMFEWVLDELGGLRLEVGHTL